MPGIDGLEVHAEFQSVVKCLLKKLIFQQFIMGIGIFFTQQSGEEPTTGNRFVIFQLLGFLVE